MRKPWMANSVCFFIYGFALYRIFTIGEKSLGLVVYGVIIGIVHLRTVQWRIEYQREERMRMTREIIES